MTKNKVKDPLYDTVAMAEILLHQKLVQESAHVIAKLQKNNNTRRVQTLAHRLEQLHQTPEPVQLTPKNRDGVELEKKGRALRIQWELTEDSLALAKRVARYSGDEVVRVFSAVPGPRGVRTWTQDIVLASRVARLDLLGLPHPAVHVAAVGFLSKTGQFVPLAHSQTLVMQP